MRCLLVVLLCTIVGLGTFGCGGGAAQVPTGPSPFAGRYVGGFTNSGGNTGELYLDITTGGIITATGINVSAGSVTILTGSMGNNGLTGLTPTGGGTSITGTLSLSNTNQLTGTLSDQLGDTVTIKLNTVVGGSTPAYAGAIAGTFSSSNGDVGNLTLLVDGNGNVTGLIVDTTKISTNTLSGMITNTGALNVTESSSGGTITGPLVIGTANQVNGTLNSSKGTTITVKLTLS